MKRAKQLQFQIKGFEKPKDWFGGSALKSNPKSKRPLDSKLPLHLILRADRSVFRQPANFARVEELVKSTASKYGVRIFEFANVGNHLHLVIRVTKLSLWAGFIRELTGRIAQEIRVKWISRPFTRIVRGWNRAYRIVKDYLILNRLEGEGYVARGSYAKIVDISEARPLTPDERRVLHSRSG